MPELANSPDAPQLEAGTYEVLRQRLAAQCEDLRTRMAQLNSLRKDVFGSIDLKLLSTERVSTEHNCVPRDMVSLGERLLFGFNVHFGLRSERSVGDVFSAYDVVGLSGEGVDGQAAPLSFRSASLDFLRDGRFEKDFQDVYRYYKDATFSRFLQRGPHLYLIFQVGKSASDVKSFKWLKDGQTLRYLDNRSDHEVKFPSQHEFEWKRTTRDAHRHGQHPHISIEDRLFVETVGGDLTIKVENNTDTGEGIYAEPVENSDQTLDDAEVSYAIVGNLILLRIRPYQEQKFRYLVYNEKTRKAQRLDAIADACVLLPDDHGLMFSSGYLLQTGVSKLFETNLHGLVFDRRISSPNGEDTLFVFAQPETGAYVLLGYNVISQSVEAPVVCHGYSLFPGGQMALFKATPEPQKHHAIQLWQTPYASDDYQPTRQTDSYLYKIGNRDIVRGMAECHEIISLAEKDDAYAGLYGDLAKLAGDVLDSYFWITSDEAANLAEPLRQIRATATAAVEEFDKVVRVRESTRLTTQQVEKKTRQLQLEIGRRQFQQLDPFVKSLSSLRAVRGEIIGLKELRYADLALVEQLEKEVVEAADKLSHKCVEFLLGEKSLQPYADAIAAEQASIPNLQKVLNVKAAEERVSAGARELEMLIDIVSNLKIDDATRRTAIIDNISVIFSTINATRAALKQRRMELASVEGTAEFASQIKLLSQSVVNFLDLCETPARCEELLTRLMVQVEELEGRFAEFDDFVIQLAEKRDEIAEAFESRRAQLIEKQNKRASALAQAADRILKGVKSRVEAMTSQAEINSYYAADLMIDKVRSIVEELTSLNDSVKVDDLQSRLKSIREDAVRQLKDRQELYEDGQNVIRFGRQRFAVNTQPLDLTAVLRDGQLLLHLTGTNFYEPTVDETLAALVREQGASTHDPLSGAAIAAMEVPSENALVYRGEFLAWQIWRTREVASPGKALPTRDELVVEAQQVMATRYREGYLKGVHDQDAATILQALMETAAQAGLLRFAPAARTLAAVYWQHFAETKRKKILELKLASLGQLKDKFPHAGLDPVELDELQRELAAWMQQHPLTTKWLSGSSQADLAQTAAASLIAELSDSSRGARGNHFVIASHALEIARRFTDALREQGALTGFQESLKALSKDVLARLDLAWEWVRAVSGLRSAEQPSSQSILEAAWLSASGDAGEQGVVNAVLQRQLIGLLGTHPRIASGSMVFELNEFLSRLNMFHEQVLPRYEQFHALKSQWLERARVQMKLSEFQPKVLTSFVRNRLIDEVYLPLIGENLAKQIGAAGEGKRTDRQGMLLLISPPGYGKTTLMEYIASRLGIVFMKINGPAIGHAVTSLDPAAAPNAGARVEIEKLNLSFEMGDNVMIYLDDIQHCHPELLQKFISLCDAQRKIEGVWRGVPRTYDFRGKKVAVVMAGNPYTESGEKFRIPDMLANRADIYNLGEIIGNSREAFETSYLENALTSNPVLARLAAKSSKDVHAMIKLAERKRTADASLPLDVSGIDFEGNHAAGEISEYVSVIEKLLRVRDVVLLINREYINSAAQHDDYRNEPPFLLQGSYRNMNRIAEKVLPVMNDDELQTLIVSSYQNDAQTLTQGAEANLLKFRHLLGIQTSEEEQRWANICRTFQQNVRLRGLGSDDKLGQAISTLQGLGDGLDAIRQALLGRESQAESKPGAPLAIDVSPLAPLISQSLEQLQTWTDRTVKVELLNAPHPSGSEASPAQPPAEQRITVVNKLPRAVYQVLEQQFELMQQWLKPLTELTTQQHQEIAGLRPLIEQCLQSYEGLLEKLELARTGDDADA